MVGKIEIYISTFLMGYLLGSVSSAILVTWIWKNKDIRTLGDGNAGVANVARSVGYTPAAIVALFDLLKGFLPVILVRMFNINEIFAVIGVIGAVIGHNFPLYFKFKGGHGLATSIGGLIALTPRSSLISLPVYGIVYFFTKGSGILATLIAFPLLIYLNLQMQIPIFVKWSPALMAMITALISLARFIPRWLKLKDKRDIIKDLFPTFIAQTPISNSVAIITDSIASLPSEILKKEGIFVVPMILIIDGEERPDDENIDHKSYYEALRNSDIVPTTSAPSPGDFLKCLDAVKEQYSSAIIIAPASNLTISYQSAHIATGQLDDEFQVEVIDTGVAGPAQGLIAIAAARLVRQGVDKEGIKLAIKEISKQVGLIGVLDTLSFLSRSGRVQSAQSVLNSPIRVYPNFVFYRKKIWLEGIDRTFKKGTERMIRWLTKHVEPGKSIMICFHTDEEERVAELKERLEELLEPQEIYITEMTPAVGAHTGPGLIGIAWWQRKK